MSEEKKEEKKEVKGQPSPPSPHGEAAPASPPQEAKPGAPVASSQGQSAPAPSVPTTGAPSQTKPLVAAPVASGTPPGPTPPMPAVTAIPRPGPAPSVVTRTPAPLPPTAAPAKKGRRGFLTLLAVVSVALALVPYVPWGDFLSSSIKGSGALVKQKVVIDNDSSYKSAAGKVVNVNDLNTFPPNSHWVITYPSSGDSTLDSQNADTFTKFELIRLPAELGGNNKAATSFVAFSKVCVHLWCSPNYNPKQGHEKYECPCHGSQYRLPDGQAVEGPAAVQPAPTNAIPILALSSDSAGQLFIEPPASGKFDDVKHNGVLGLGRTLFKGGGTTNEYKFEDGTSAN